MAIPHALAAKYKLKVGAGTALSSTDLKKSARRSPSRSSSRPGSRESVTPPDEPGSGGLPGAIVEKKKKRRKKKAGADGGQGGEPAETALQMAMRSSQGMKGGTSVVRQMSMLQRPGVVPASASASSAVAAAGTRSSPSDPVTAEESETRESNQRKALKELMIKFEHNQRQMAEAQRQLIEGKTSVFSGVSRAKMGLMLLANNLTVLICSFIVFFLVYNLDPLPPGTLTAVHCPPCAHAHLVSRDCLAACCLSSANVLSALRYLCREGRFRPMDCASWPPLGRPRRSRG
eukprot:COSAG01_NODE_1145_length_11530_cov_3.387280_5_plen_289_part_00